MALFYPHYQKLMTIMVTKNGGLIMIDDRKSHCFFGCFFYTNPPLKKYGEQYSILRYIIPYVPYVYITIYHPICFFGW